MSAFRVSLHREEVCWAWVTNINKSVSAAIVVDDSDHDSVDATLALESNTCLVCSLLEMPGFQTSLDAERLVAVACMETITLSDGCGDWCDVGW